MGLDILRVALMTDHKTWTMLRRYTEIKPEDVHSAVKKTGARSRTAAKAKAASRGMATDTTAGK